MSTSPTVQSNLGTLEESRAVNERGIPLYNAGDIRREFQIAGIFYTFEPRSVKEIGARKEVRWRKNMTRDVDKKGNPMSPLVVREGGDAQTIANEILSAGQDSGICRLMSDGLDDQRTGLAWERYIAWRCERARALQAHWLGVVERASKSPGALPPRQPANVRAEIAFLTDHASGATDRKPWISRLDGYDCATREELVAYIERSYPDQVQQYGIDSMIIQRDHAQGRAPLPEDMPRPAPPREPIVPQVVRPIPSADDLNPATLAAETASESASDPLDTRFLLTKARELKIALTGGELEGLIDGDVMTIENVTLKLAEASQAQKRTARVRA